MSSAKGREEEARNILARANKNQADDGPSTRKAAIRAYRYLHIMATQHGALIQQAYVAAKTHAARGKGPIDPKDTAGYHPLPDELPTVPPELTSGLLHCLSTLNHPGEIGHHQETPRNSSQVEIGWALPEHIFETRNEQNFQDPNKLLSLFEKVFWH